MNNDHTEKHKLVKQNAFVTTLGLNGDGDPAPSDVLTPPSICDQILHSGNPKYVSITQSSKTL